VVGFIFINMNSKIINKVSSIGNVTNKAGIKIATFISNKRSENQNGSECLIIEIDFSLPNRRSGNENRSKCWF
jgi:hypothetical protein